MEKKEKYLQLLKQAKQLVDPKVGRISNMANLSRLLFDVFQHHWCGFYLVENGRLELGPFQGPIACTTIEKGKGVCGSSWEKRETLVIEDVHQFDGHIACSALSNSEIVVPCFNQDGEVYAVLDIDSVNFDEFNEVDKECFEQLVKLL